MTALLLAIVVVLGQIPFGRPTGESVLSLALRTTRASVEVCRDRSAAELDQMPQHMRQPRVCDTHRPDYDLRVRVDGAEVAAQRLEHGGLRGDRPLIVDRRIPVAPGSRRLEVSLSPVAATDLTPEVRAAVEGLPTWRLDRRADFVAERVTLVLADDDLGELVIFDDPSVRDRASAPPAGR